VDKNEQQLRQKKWQRHEDARMAEAKAIGVSDLTIRNCSAPILVGLGSSSRRSVGVQIADSVDDVSVTGSSTRNMSLLHVDGDVDRLVQSDNLSLADASGRKSFFVRDMHIGNVGAARDRAAGLKSEMPEVERPRGKSMASIPDLPWKREKQG